MQSTQKLFQVFVLRDQAVRPSRWFSRESLAKRYCQEFNAQSAPNQARGNPGTPGNPGQTEPNRAIATYKPVELPTGPRR